MASSFSSTNSISDDNHGHPLRSGDVSPIWGDPSSSHTPSFSVENDVVELLEVENTFTQGVSTIAIVP